MELQKQGDCDVTLSASNDVCRHVYQLSASSNINYGELSHRTEKRFSLPYLIFLLKMSLKITHSRERVHSSLVTLLSLSIVWLF